MDRNAERVKRLRNRLIKKPEVCIERGVLVTESYKETEGREAVYRQAKAFENVLGNISVAIDNDELIVGKLTSKDRGGLMQPEIFCQFLEDQMDELSTRPYDTFEPISKENQAVIREILQYWKTRELAALWTEKIPPEKLNYLSWGFAGGVVSSLNSYYLTHTCVDFEKVLRNGLLGIKREVEHEISSLNLADPDDFNKLQFLNASLISLDAVINFANRYSKLAAEMAKKCNDQERKAELEMISAVCAKVPANPATTFFEAIQSISFIWCAIDLEGQGNGLGLGRLDQLLYPFYKLDKETGKITYEEAKMLVSMLFVKVNEVLNVSNRMTAIYFTGFPQTINVIIGGVTADGKDAVNEMSYICLDADEAVALTQNDTVVRISEKTPDEFVVRAVEVAKALRGKVKFMSDEMCIKQLLSDGRNIRDAREYCITGCNNPTIPGKTFDTPGGNINMPIFLELALNNGKRRLDGKLVGVETGDPCEFKSYEDVFDAYKKQVEAFMPIVIMYRNSDRMMYAQYRPTPFQSMLFDGPLKSGKDMANGGVKQSRLGMALSGTPNVGDSLAAIKKVVFEDKKITMGDLVKALDNNFEGYEKVHKLLSDAPKYGNDIDYVDNIVNDVLMHGVDCVTNMKGACGLKFNVSAAAVTANIRFGQVVGALPDGRKAGLPVSEGGISPYQGRNVSGPVATYKSVAKIDHARLTNGSVFNMRFTPSAFKDESSMRKFVYMMRTYLESGGFFVQYNIVDTDTLRAAQKEPEKYRDLLVRVATYSAYFVELGPDLQNDIINRIEFEI